MSVQFGKENLDGQLWAKPLSTWVKGDACFCEVCSAKNQ